MALAPNSPPREERLTPWLVPAYVASLALLFAGERIVPGLDTLHYGLSGLGVLGIAAVTVLRFAQAARTTGERRVMERRLAFLSLGGIVAVALYFCTTDSGMRLLGVATAEPATRARYEGVLTVGYIGLLALTVVPLVLGELALHPMRRAERPEARRVADAIVSGVSLAAAAVYASLLVFAVTQLDVKADYSYFRTARVSESTVKVAQGIEGDVKIVAFFPALSDVGIEVEGYLKSLADAAPNVSLEVHDRLLVPALAKEKKITADGVVTMSRGDATERLTIGTDMKTAARKLKTIDADLQKELLKLYRKQRTAYLTVGHGELNEPSQLREKEGRSVAELKKILQSQNYVVKDLGPAQLATAGVPDDAALVLVLGPETPFEPQATQKLAEYAERGGKLLMALDPDGGADHGALAETVQLTVDPSYLVNDKRYLQRRNNDADKRNLAASGDPRLGGGFSSHASVSTLSKLGPRAMLVFLGASALDKRAGGDAKVDFVVRSSRETFSDPNANYVDDEGEKRAVQNLAAAVSRAATAPAAAPDAKEKEGNDADGEMRAFVLGDADALSDFALVQSDVHRVFAFDAIRWLGGEESFAGAIATTEDKGIEHTQQEDAVWFYATIVGAPALFLGLGLYSTRRQGRPRPKPGKPEPPKRATAAAKPARTQKKSGGRA